MSDRAAKNKITWGHITRNRVSRNKRGKDLGSEICGAGCRSGHTSGGWGKAREHHWVPVMWHVSSPSIAGKVYESSITPIHRSN